MKKILLLLIVITVFFSLSTVVAADSIYVVGMDTTQYNDLVPEGFTLKSNSLMRYPHANRYVFFSDDSSDSVDLCIGIYPNKDKLITSVESFFKDASDTQYYKENQKDRVVGDI